MEPKIIYPIPLSQSHFYRRLRSLARIIFIVAAAVCVLINALVKGKAWSLVVVWSLLGVWNLFFSLRLVEFSVFSHAVRGLVHVVVLLILIDAFLAPGWADTVVPIVFFGAMALMLIVYYATYSRRNRHTMAIVLLGFVAIIAIPYYTHSLPITNWVAFAFQIASLVLFLILLISNGKDILKELKVRFRVRSD